MTYEVIATDSTGRERDAWIVEAESKMGAVQKGVQEVAHSKTLPIDDYTFKARPCTVAGHRLKER